MTHDQLDQSKWFRHSTTAHGFRWRSTFAQQEQKLKLNLWKVDYFFPRFSLNTNSRGLMMVGSNWQGCCEKSAMRHETQISLLQLHCNRPFSLSRLVSATCLWFWICWRICPKRPVSWGWESGNKCMWVWCMWVWCMWVWCMWVWCMWGGRFLSFGTSARLCGHTVCEYALAHLQSYFLAVNSAFVSTAHLRNSAASEAWIQTWAYDKLQRKILGPVNFQEMPCAKCSTLGSYAVFSIASQEWTQLFAVPCWKFSMRIRLRQELCCILKRIRPERDMGHWRLEGQLYTDESTWADEMISLVCWLLA